MGKLTILLLIFLTAILIFLSDCAKKEDNQINCIGLVTDTLGKNDPVKIWMPNAFTPDGNGLNDCLRPWLISVAAISFTVYDEENSIVFNTNDPSEGFCPDQDFRSNYYYKIQVTTEAGNQIGLCGSAHSFINCVPESYQDDILYLLDQLDPELGFILPTAETPCK
jgi:hypothetical protein